ncbi:MAG: glycosyltransferase family 4 protein [Lachnospiraceae bacterium]|nr:glycosyltransferase family 4 protein [Lachnospiraceae bacterium]
MKITVIAGYYPPEQSADTRLNQDLVESLAKRGEDVTLIVPFPSRGVSEKVQKEYLNKKYEKINDHLEIYRVGKPKKYKQGIVKRGIVFLIKSFQLYKIAKKMESDICFIVSTPPTLGYIAALLSKKKKVIYKLQDAFPDSLIHTKNMNEKAFTVKFFRKLESWIYRKVSRICTVSDDLKKTLLSRNVPEEKISVIYDWIDENKCLPVNREANFLFDKFNLDRSKLYIVYGGNIGLLQNLKTIVLVSERFKESNPELGFVIIGDGSWKTELDRILEAGDHSNVFCFPMQPTEDIAYVYSLGDIGLVSLQPGVTKIALPSKTWDIMSAGRAVLCEIDLYSGLCNIVKENKTGYCVEPNDVDGMEKTIRKMLSDREEMKKMGERGREYICNHLTRDAAVERYIQIFGKELEV